jgi:hypothetical protein
MTRDGGTLPERAMRAQQGRHHEEGGEAARGRVYFKLG